MSVRHIEKLPTELQPLHDAYASGKLRVLVGAGVSTLSGLPTWDELGTRLTESYLESHVLPALDSGLREMLPPSEIRAAAKSIVTAIGREALPALLAVEPQGGVSSSRIRPFPELLREALYCGRDVGSLYIHDVQKQLASMALHAQNHREFLYTTNFDPMLELAIGELLARRKPATTGDNSDRAPCWKQMVDPAPSGSGYGNGDGALPLVRHVHGFLDNDARFAGGLVLGESDFQYLQSDEVEESGKQAITELFARDGATLIVGMSLSDPHMRRQLYLRRRFVRDIDSRQVFALLRSRGPVTDPIVTASLWKNWRVRPVFVSEYWKMTAYLRHVQYGLDPGHRWISSAREWTDGVLGTARAFSDDWQRRAHTELGQLNAYVRKWHAVPDEEETQVALFGLTLPPKEVADSASPRVYKLATTRHLRSLKCAVEEAVDLVATVAHGAERSAVGLAFSEGLFYDSVDVPGIINYRLDEAAERRWNSNYAVRDWRSLYVVPVLAGDRHLPIAVVTLTSTRTDPFWRRAPAAVGEDRVRLRDYLRRIALWLLESSEHGFAESPFRDRRGRVVDRPVPVNRSQGESSNLRT